YGGAYGRAFAIGAGLNIAFVIVEAVFGWISGSLALLADAGHNLGDVLALLLAWGAVILARRSPSDRRTYGLRRATILAALISALLMLFAVIGIGIESVRRLASPAPVAGTTVIIVAAVGVVINTITVMLFHRDRRHDLNIRSAWLHMAADAAVSAGVVIAGVAMVMTGWLWLDPAISLAIAAVILVATWQLLTESVDMSVDAVPRQVDPVAVRQYLTSIEGVAAVHDLHIWPTSTSETALTAHLVMPGGGDDELLQDIASTLDQRYHVHHPTIQIEHRELPDCLGCDP
ncbi:MAG: cation diffusion facilitator family transporter, partial [Gammaproteobacteria bacterium]|nr:cation diffusion facilitator family transporter [Gammaproteobacteria bacterium]